MSETTVFKLTLRRAALLHTLRTGQYPWRTEPDGIDTGATRGNGQREWILCCGHRYRDDEIAEMARLGWIGIEQCHDRRGAPYRITVAGPKIADAWQWPHYG